MQDFDLLNGDNYRTSTPYYTVAGRAWGFYANEDMIVQGWYAARDGDSKVRCFKDSSSEPQTIEYRWQIDSTCSSNVNDYT
jgi:hypothetical protein